MNDKPLDNMASKVFEIPEAEFEKLVTALELRRLKPAQQAASVAMLTQIRPRLRLIRPERRFTPMRLFCRPFEDLLYNPNTPRKALGRIPRSALKPIWSETEALLGADGLAPVLETLKTLDPADAEAVDAAGRPFWSAAHKVLKGLRDESGKIKGGPAKLQEQLGGPEVLASLDDIITALSVAAPLTEMRRKLPPPPIADVNKADLMLIVDGLTRTAALNRDGLPMLVLSLMTRLQSPAMLPSLIERLIDEGAGDLIQSMGGQVGEAVASQQEDRIIDVRAAAETKKDDPVAVARALGNELKTLQREAQAAGGGGRGVARQIERVKAELGRVARETIVSGAAPKAMAAIESLDTPPESATGNRDRFRAIEDQIVSLRLCKQYAGDVGLEAEIATAMKQISAKLDTRSDDLLKRLQADDVTVSTVDLFCTVRLVELTEGPEKADKLREKGMAALRGE
ncbi:hypothetical protein T8K17_13450 [Thalassobaculum sp. OXR-137]|uniref:hypothetical protein n=1 Tax=Thalassobaculum sp. OXR-137 TaxID=3100173 RepID=UPI002AC8DE8E|nr:hypothetical protein [Thalassobaculum sp. OXR-137]WPZ32247.1 hypothetical protein T8K17_13450 [Thalassobaculum sp. OXR-137]